MPASLSLSVSTSLPVLRPLGFGSFWAYNYKQPTAPRTHAPIGARLNVCTKLGEGQGAPANDNGIPHASVHATEHALKREAP